ncbi:hemagglutinin repeat-containing protein [Marinomonas sp. THO17]|uniref:hemagglutinin repeat-containing protein n=1 Tax=Marinomonas sp. THO17 TaxID=3149048 RepID=UPI00336C01BE
MKNAYADTYLAVRALDQAKDAVKDAKAAYEDAKQKVKDGKLPKSDLDFYKANLAVATANVASATTAVAASGAAAAAAASTSAGTGFYATAGVTTQTDTSSTTTSQGQWKGSNLQVGGNTSLTSDNNLNIEGSNVATGGQLALNASNINITAGKNTLTESTESHSEGANASYGINKGSVSGGINANQSSSDSQSVTHINSQLVAGNLVSKSDNLTIAGGKLDAASIDITTDQLVVTSLHDTSSSHSESLGGNIGAGGDGISNIGVNASQSEAERAWVAQQSGITGGQVNITANDTSLTGAVLASTNAQGEDNGQLTLTTKTLNVSDIEDIDESKNLGFSLSGGGDTTNIGANFDGYEKAQITKATIGLGNVTVGGDDINEQAQFADLNRDVTNSQEITKDVERGGLNANLRVDNRLLTETGRQKIAKDITDTTQHASEIAQAVVDVMDTNQGVVEVFDNVKNYAIERTALVERAMDKKAQEKLKGEEGAEGSQEGMQELSDALTKAQGLEEKANVALYDGSLVQDDTLVIDKTEVNKSEVEGAYHEGGNTIYANIDKTDMTDSSKVVATLVHEQTRHRLSQEGSTGSLSRDDQTTLATNHGDRAEEVWNAYSKLAGISTTSSTSQSSWNAANRNTSVVQAGTKQIVGVNNSELKARQFTRTEASLLDQARAKIQDSALSEEAKAEKITELEQIACAKVKCAAGVSENDQLYDSLNALQKAGEEQVASGENIYDVLHKLGVKTPTKSNGRMGGRSESTFGYNEVTALNDAIDSNEKLVTKTTQVASAMAGGAEVATGAALCATGVGCPAGGALATLGAITVKQSVDALNSEYVYKSGQRVTDSFSLETHGGSHNPALDAAVDLGVSVTSGAVVKTALKLGDDAYDAAKSALKDGAGAKGTDNVTNAEGFKVPDTVTRQDNDFKSPTFIDDKGNIRDKAYIKDNGDLTPVDPNGTVSVKSHVQGGAKNNQNISTSDPSGSGTPKVYGSEKIEIDTKGLQEAINRGEVKDVKIITPKQVLNELTSDLEKAQKRFDMNPSVTNKKKLKSAISRLNNASRDNECIISGGCVPSKFIKKVE